MKQALNLKVVLPLFLLAFSCLCLSTAALEQSGKTVLTVRLEGTITSMSYELVGEALAYAEARGEPVILLINTPGGMIDATFKIVEEVERSRVPVVGYVYPPGGKAWSAGTYILMACHVAGMAPHTLIGSCQPVAFNPLEGGSKPVEDSKVLNAMEKFLVERAKAHGRNEEAARRFVAENLNLDDEEALREGVIEFRAKNVEDLLRQVDGLEVEVEGGSFKLETRGALVEEWNPSLKVRVLSLLSEPMVAYLLLIIGLYGLIFGLASPGVGGEVLGALLLILGLIGLGVTGANVGAIILMVVGLVLLLAELLTPGFGVMGGTGFACVLLGSLLLFPGGWTVQPEWLDMFYMVLILVPLTVGSFLIFAAYKVVKVRRRRPFQPGILGEKVEVVEEVSPSRTGFVRLRGELWKAKSRVPLVRGEKAKVVGKEGPVLVIEPLKEGEV